MVYRYLVAIILICGSGFAFCQNGDSKNQPQQKSTSLQPYYPQEKKFSEKQRRIDAAKTTVDLQDEYYERVEAVMKSRKKLQKQMRKPQYSNPMYFGHKRPPKKNSVKKMKFCNECGIRH